MYFKEYFKEYFEFSFIKYNNGKLIKDIRNIFRLKKEQNYTGIKDIKIFLDWEKK